MKTFQCGAVVPSCEWHKHYEDEHEIIRSAVEHLRETHGEDIIRETMIEAIRGKIENDRHGG